MALMLILCESRVDFGSEFKKYMPPNNIGSRKTWQMRIIMLASERLRVNKSLCFDEGLHLRRNWRIFVEASGRI